MTRIKRPGTTSLLAHSLVQIQRNPRRKRRRDQSFHRSVVLVCIGGCFVVTGSLVKIIGGLSSLFPRSSHHSNPEIKQLQQIFPVHTCDDEMEDVDHPGFQMADSVRLSAIFGDVELPKTMKVPKFWNPPAYGGVREFLGNNGRYLITKEEADAIGSKHNGEETIFISLASYRDPECTPTVESIFQRAKNPNRIRVAIIDQRKNDEDPSCNRPLVPCEQDPGQVLCRFEHLIDYREYEAHLMVGPTFARHIGHRMYRGEYFSMQVDSHVRFVEHWDEDIIDQWTSAGDEMAVLTTYMSDVVNSIDPVSHKSLRENRAIMCNALFDGIGDSTEHIRFGVQPNSKPKIKSSPMLEPFWAAGFSFARGHFLVQVPYDAYLPLVFQGEEISMTVRGFTYGYDFFAPVRNVAFHMYAIRGNQEQRLKVKTFIENETIFPGAKEKAYHRLNGIIRLSKAAPFYDKEQSSYGLGNARTPHIFYRTFGISPERSEMEPRLCDFVRGVSPHKSMHDQLSPFLRKDGMGIDYGKVGYVYRERPLTDSVTDSVELVTLQASIRKRTMEKM